MKRMLFVAILGAAVGCDNSDQEGAKGAQSSSPGYQEAHKTSVPSPVPVTPPEGTPASPGSYSGPGTPTDVGTTRPGEVGASAVNAAQRAAANNPAVSAATQAAGAQGAAADQGAQVQTQVDQVVQYVKEKKYDLAEKALNALDQQRAGWSTATQQQYGPKIDMARQALTAAKGGGGALDALKGAAFPSGSNK